MITADDSTGVGLAPAAGEGALPRFSVIVPTYNRPRPLAKCLAALAELDYPKECFEVIVVDDGGVSDLSDVIEPVRHRIGVRLIRQVNSGPSVARNAGAAAAKNAFLAFTDDDCMPYPDWLRKLASALCDDPKVMVGGESRNTLTDNPCAAASQLILDVVYTHFNHDAQNAIFFPSDNIAILSRQFRELGGFDPTFRYGEDREFCDRLRTGGVRLVLVSDAVVDHAHEMGLMGFCKQHFGYGRGAWLYHHARQLRSTGKLEVEGSFYLKCFRQAFKTEPLARATRLALLLCIWQLANAAGFFCEFLSRRRHQAINPAERPGAARADVSQAPMRSIAHPEAPAKE